ncbi:MAG: FkbM family methyltransferase [Geothrix sp.]|nr:FkbM family methyltransferase [Geothrix sp.]
MVFVSFAQNHEDTILWRALKHVPNGCYIDVGAYDPDIHSVTKAFYERGWRGINFEPVQTGHDLLRQFRPLDVNLRLAISAEAGTVPFFHIKETGLSTLDRAVAGRHQEGGWVVEEMQIQAAPLREVWDAHIHGEVHFLKVDVEGAEGIVLASLDLARQRPWIIVVEATLPLSQEESHSGWEGILIDAGYIYVCFDGLNRYYLAKEHPEIRAELARPRSVFDEAISESEQAAVKASQLFRKQRDRLMGLVASTLGGFDARRHPHLIPHLANPLPTLVAPGSQLCTQSQFEEPLYARWCSLLKEEPCAHRKQWEFVYILQSLWTRGLLRPGMRGLGFGCGNEPLAAAMAAYGCEVVATDLDPEDTRSKDWRDTDQHAAGKVEALNTRGICPPDLFGQRVRYRNVDMNHIPEDLSGFDFTWSSCALEHIGSIRNGLDFIRNATACLKPGGWAVHTTEFNLTSNLNTLESPGLSLFRVFDLETVAAEIRQDGHEVIPFNFNPGDTLPDHHVDLPPFENTPESVHLRLRIADHTITSVGIAIRRGAVPEASHLPEPPATPVDEALQPLLAAIEADPRNTELFLEVARLLEVARDFDSARQFLEAGLDQNPQSPILWQALVDQSMARGDATMAAKDAWDALSQLPSGGAGEWHLRVARSLLVRGVLEEARTVLERGISVFPDHLPLLQLRAALPR